MTTPEDILKFLQPRLNGATRSDEITAMMIPFASDSGWAYLGGSGSRQQIFQLEGNLRAVFQFNGTDKLEAYGVYRSTESWKQTPEVQVSPAPSSDLSLILVEDKND